jgi:hypothetical protein
LLTLDERRWSYWKYTHIPFETSENPPEVSETYGRRDGIPTLFGYDYGRKGKPDRWVPVNPPHQ